MSLDITLREPRKLTGYHVLAILIGFFLTVTAVNVVMMYDAISTFAGLETDDAYRKGLAYNQTIAQGEAQDKLGWTAAIEATAAGRTVTLTLADKDKAPIQGATLSGEVGRAATNRYDTALAFRETAPGHYEATLEKGLEPGAWIAHLSAIKANSNAEDMVFEVRQRLWIAP